MPDTNTDTETRSKKSFGCLTLVTLLGLSSLAAGVYLMGQWDTLAGPAKGGSVVLVVLGTLLLLPPLLILLITLVMKVLLGRLTKGLSQATADMIAANKQIYGQLHEFRPATPEDFEGLNLAFYDDTQRALESLGHRHLGDIVDQTMEESSGLTAPIRVLSSVDGATTVALYHFKLPNLPAKFAGRDMLICDVTTEFSDGTFLITSNTAESDLTTTPPRLIKHRHPLDTPVSTLVSLHESERAKRLAATPNLTCTTINILDDAIASEKRQQQAKNDFRKDINYLDPEEVRRIASTPDSDDAYDDSDDDDNTPDPNDKPQSSPQTHP